VEELYTILKKATESSEKPVMQKQAMPFLSMLTGALSMYFTYDSAKNLYRNYKARKIELERGDKEAADARIPSMVLDGIGLIPGIGYAGKALNRLKGFSKVSKIGQFAKASDKINMLRASGQLQKATRLEQAVAAAASRQAGAQITAAQLRNLPKAMRVDKLYNTLNKIDVSVGVGRMLPLGLIMGGHLTGDKNTQRTGMEMNDILNYYITAEDLEKMEQGSPEKGTSLIPGGLDYSKVDPDNPDLNKDRKISQFTRAGEKLVKEILPEDII
jgi:hypothetical protein